MGPEPALHHSDNDDDDDDDGGIKVVDRPASLQLHTTVDNDDDDDDATCVCAFSASTEMNDFN